MSDPRPATITHLVDEGILDANLAALLWMLAEARVPLVVATTDAGHGERLRRSIAALKSDERTTADGGLPGGVLVAQSLEDVMRRGGSQPGEEVPDAVRDIGVVVVLGASERPADGPQRRVVSAHYVRPVERDGAGHLQRRPPALLSAWDERSQRLDHFHWGSTGELAARAEMSAADFEEEHARRTGLIEQLVAAGVFDPDGLRTQVARANLMTIALARANSTDERH